MERNYIIRDIFMTSNKIRRLLDKYHQKNGIYLSQARILSYLYRNKDEKIYQKDLEKAFQIRGGSVTGMLDSLQTNNLIVRTTSSTDKRKRKLELTEEGNLKAEQAIKTITDFESAVESLLSEEELSIFKNVFLKLNEYIDEEEKR